MYKTSVFKISGMHCPSCSMNIDFDLEDVAGIKEAKTNYAKSVSYVTFDPEIISQNKIVEIIKKTGYSAVIQ